MKDAHPGAQCRASFDEATVLRPSLLPHPFADADSAMINRSYGATSNTVYALWCTRSFMRSHFQPRSGLQGSHQGSHTPRPGDCTLTNDSKYLHHSVLFRQFTRPYCALAYKRAYAYNVFASRHFSSGANTTCTSVAYSIDPISTITTVVSESKYCARGQENINTK